MIGVLLITHARVASETKAAIEHILGKQKQFVAIDVVNSDATEQERLAVVKTLDALDEGDGILVLVDLLGATPWNMVQKIAIKQHVEMVAGFNMPAVMKAVMLRKDDIKLKTLALRCVDEGCKYLCVGSDIEQGGIA